LKVVMVLSVNTNTNTSININSASSTATATTTTSRPAALAPAVAATPLAPPPPPPPHYHPQEVKAKTTFFRKFPKDAEVSLDLSYAHCITTNRVALASQGRAEMNNFGNKLLQSECYTQDFLGMRNKSLVVTCVRSYILYKGDCSSPLRVPLFRPMTYAMIRARHFFLSTCHRGFKKKCSAHCSFLAAGIRFSRVVVVGGVSSRCDVEKMSISGKKHGNNFFGLVVFFAYRDVVPSPTTHDISSILGMHS
jgi:hypothetical protein